MKRKKLFLLMIAFLLIGTSRVVGQEKSDAAPVNLKGIWPVSYTHLTLPTICSV